MLTLKDARPWLLVGGPCGLVVHLFVFVVVQTMKVDLKPISNSSLQVTLSTTYYYQTPHKQSSLPRKDASNLCFQALYYKTNCSQVQLDDPILLCNYTETFPGAL